MGPEGSGALAGALGGGVLGSGALGGRVQGNGTTEAGEARLHWESLLLLLIPTLTIFGNGLVVLSILREKSLKTVTNYFIFSLAVADFLVALLVMPFAVYVEVSGTRWLLGHVWCNIYIAFDVCASTASIFNLLAISVDRYIAITRPIHYSRMGKSGSRAFGTICFVWALSFLIAVPIVAGINEYDEAHAEQCVYTNAVYIAISSFMSFYIPAAVMGVLYVIILVKLRQRAKAAERRKKRRTQRKEAMMAGNGADISPDGKVLGLRAYASQIFGGAQLMKDIGSRMEALASEAETTTIGDKLSETFRPRFSPLLGRRSSVWLPQSVAQRRLTRRASSFDAGTLDYSTSEDEDEEDGEASSNAAQRNRSRLESDVSRASLPRKPASLPTLHPPDPKPQVSEVSGIEALRAKLSLQGVREAAEDGEVTGAPDRPSAAPDEETRFGSVSLDEIPFIDQNSSRPSSLHQKNSVQVRPFPRSSPM